MEDIISEINEINLTGEMCGILLSILWETEKPSTTCNLTSKNDSKKYRKMPFHNTVCFIDIGKLNLLMVVRFISTSQFLQLTQRPLKTTLSIKDIKIDSEKIFLLPESKSVKQTEF
jgi:hypothetical protein